MPSVTKLEFDGSLEHGGTTYFIYSRVGSAAGLEIFISSDVWPLSPGRCPVVPTSAVIPHLG